MKRKRNRIRKERSTDRRKKGREKRDGRKRVRKEGKGDKNLGEFGILLLA